MAASPQSLALLSAAIGCALWGRRGHNVARFSTQETFRPLSRVSCTAFSVSQRFDLRTTPFRAIFSCLCESARDDASFSSTVLTEASAHPTVERVRAPPRGEPK